MKKIHSKYIIDNIFSYTDKLFKFKIFLYSKINQKKCNIRLYDYQKIYFDKIKINSLSNYFKYLCFEPNSENNFKHLDTNDGKKTQLKYLNLSDSDPDSSSSNYPIIFNKNGKTELLEENLLKYHVDINGFKNYVKNDIEAFKELFIKQINEEYLIRIKKKYEEEYDRGTCIDDFYKKEELMGFKKLNEGIKIEIDISSPFFDILCKSKFFGQLFIIPIYSKFIKDFKLKEEYINAFEKLNEINSNYSIFFKFNKSKDIRYLKDFNIDFTKIKNLKIQQQYEEQNLGKLFRELFGLKNIKNNIIDLDIQIYNSKIDKNILENLNKFKVLEHLTLKGFNSKTRFELKIKALKTLNISECGNIYINEDIPLSLKRLILINNNNNISESLLKLPQLEYLELTESAFSSINFNSLNNLKKIKYFISNKLTQILSIKSLKEIHIGSEVIHNDLASIHDKNPSVNKLIYNYYFKDNYNYLYDNIDEILKKFPNLTELIIISKPFSTEYKNDEIGLKLKENPNCKINKISLFLYYGNINIYCQNFKKLEKIEIKTGNIKPKRIKNIDDSLPMFRYKCEIVYISLIELNLRLNQFIDLKIFQNLKNHIGNMPYLKKIYLYFKTNIDKDTYEEFIRKLLLLKLEFINIELKFVSDNYENFYNLYNYNDKVEEVEHEEDDNNVYYYSLEELKLINKNMSFLNFLNFENIKIKKYPKIRVIKKKFVHLKIKKLTN